jgi:hypothetical protein
MWWDWYVSSAVGFDVAGFQKACFLIEGTKYREGFKQAE